MTHAFFLPGSARTATSLRSFSTQAANDITPSSPFARERTRPGLRPGFLAADHERVGHFLHLGAADLRAEPAVG